MFYWECIFTTNPKKKKQDMRDLDQVTFNRPEHMPG